ncbi:MAG: GGDEF domain-containing protein [Candidatus Omnitrophota bacterium]
MSNYDYLLRSKISRNKIKLLPSIKNLSKKGIVLIGVFIVLFLGIIDYLTGYEISFSLFYLLAIILVSWSVGQAAGLFISVCSAITWYTADIASGHVYSHYFIPFWNTAIRLGFFIIISRFLVIMQKSFEHERELAQTDPLTGIANSRYFHERMVIEIEKAIRFKRPLTLAYFDIDNFKQINDSYGHKRGDELLQRIVNILKNNLRSIDIIGRLGGDEWAVLLPEANEQQAKIVVERGREKISNNIDNKGCLSITFSIGVITCVNAFLPTDELIKAADSLMYLAKKNGKNAVEYRTYSL